MTVAWWSLAKRKHSLMDCHTQRKNFMTVAKPDSSSKHHLRGSEVAIDSSTCPSVFFPRTQTFHISNS